MPSGDSRTGSGGPTFHSPCGNLYSSINTSISEKSTPFGVEGPQTRPLCTPHSTSSSSSIKLNLKDRWCPNLPGQQPSIVTRKRSSTFTRIDPENSRTTRVGCKRSLDTVGTEVSSLSSRLMKPSEQCSQETTGLRLTILSQLPHSSTACLDKGRASVEDPRGGALTKETGIFVGGTMSEKPTKTVGSDTSVSNVREVIGNLNVPVERTGRCQMLDRWRTLVRNPKYRQGFVWDAEVEASTPSVMSTLYHKPLPDVPMEDYSYTIVSNMIDRNPHLFDIITPIRVDVLEELLMSHPNHNFVGSVLCGFREGFWPSASAEWLVCKPEGYDNHWSNEDFSEDSLAFMRAQRDVEIALKRYSESFGSTLLPGMVSQPCFLVPKPGTAKFRLINDHTAGLFALNAAIPVEKDHSDLIT